LTQSNFRIGDRPGSLLGYTQVRIKICRKDYDWSVGLVYDSRGLPGVTTVRPAVAGVLYLPRGERTIRVVNDEEAEVEDI
jgi:hypothetical protein